MNKTSLLGSARTQGDGMENTNTATGAELNTKPVKHIPGESLIYRPSTSNTNPLNSPVIPKGKIINLTPKTVQTSKPARNYFKVREPKFVLYEPYKAAVSSIFPVDRKSSPVLKKTMKNNLDLTKLVAHMSLTNTEDIKNDKPAQDPPLPLKKFNCVKDCDNEKTKLQSELKRVREENSSLESQLTFQAQVNTELKTMLVAAVGEDMQTKVNLLTEDKLHLAKALLSTVENLSTHQEQIEWLAGQCEVWRSKFLASSLMVEELARWKTTLSQRTCDLNVSIRFLLNEMNQIRDKQLCSFTNLKTLSNWNTTMTSVNVLDLTDYCHELSEKLSGASSSSSELNCKALIGITPAQEQAEKLLRTPVILPTSDDEACRAVVCQAGVVGSTLFPNVILNNSPKCCPHCKEETLNM